MASASSARKPAIITCVVVVALLLVGFVVYKATLSMGSGYYLGRAIVEMRTHHPDAAMAHLNKAILLNPQNAPAYTLRAELEYENGDIDAEIADLDHVIELKPRDDAAFSSRSIAKTAKNDIPAALADAKKAIEINPKYARHYGNLGWVELFARQPKESIAASLKGLELDSTQVWMNSNLAHAYLLDGQFEKAKDIYLKYWNDDIEQGGTFGEAVQSDFKELRKAGITSPDMDRMEKLFPVKQQ
jgi:tetratricopeptide (TPR) repeat protein